MATNNAINSSYPIGVSDGGTGAATFTDHGVLVGSGAAAITALTVGTDGQVLIGATGADPAFATITSTGGTVAFTPGANTLNIEASPALIVWSEITADSKTIVVNEAYVANYGTLLTFTLPASSAVGDEFIIAGKGAGGWQVAQGASQQIILDGAGSTVGAGGHMDSTDQYDCVEVVCTTADTIWTVMAGDGSPSIT